MGEIGNKNKITTDEHLWEKIRKLTTDVRRWKKMGDKI